MNSKKNEENFRNESNKVLDVKNLRVSFYTVNGTVKAVRGIDLSLYKGKTLAIVGESGSGKSVTSRAIMGILAQNRIIEEGQILYDGKDILQLSEDELTKIRGSKISMIFQDPMSSLNPIMKVGKQVTEAMVLKEKSTIKEAKKKTNYLLSRINTEGLKSSFPGYSTISLNKNFVDSVLNKTEFKDFDFKALIDALFVSNRAEVDDIRKKALVEIETIKNEIIIDNSINVANYKKNKKRLAALMNEIEDKLLSSRENIISTFSVLVNYSVSNYIGTVKRILKEEKRQKKFEGKTVSEQAEIKARAFGSEIVVTPEIIAKHLSDSFAELIEYLNDSINSKAKHTSDAFIQQLNENIVDAHLKVDKKDIYNRAVKVLSEVGIPEPAKRMKQYPFQFSGGMRQRIVIAIALSSNPEILICDEPTTALDVTIQAQILDLIDNLKKKRNLSIVFITHNLGVVARMADDVAVMYAGKIVEYGTVDEIFYEPCHPYTWALLASMPDLDSKEKLDAIPGTPPNMIIPPVGDAFAARNKYAMKIDFEKQPDLFEVSPTHFAATWLLHPSAPKVEPPKIVINRINKMKAAIESQKQIKGGKSNANKEKSGK